MTKYGVMTTEILEQAIASTRSVVARVTKEQLTDNTPCAKWKVSDLINHLIGGQHFFEAGINGTPRVGSEADHFGDRLPLHVRRGNGAHCHGLQC
jgi:hypothetical protein